MKRSNVFQNTAMLYIMSFAKLILPLLTMPYLTRVLSEDSYGFMAYVRSCMTYMQLIIDFGFILSSVKDIVNAKDDKRQIGTIAGNTFLAKSILCVIAAIVTFIMCFAIDILKLDIFYVVLSFVSVATTIFLADFLFRGIEKMHYITIIFLITKSISTILTFILVKNDDTMMWIPVLEILAHIISIAISIGILKKLEIKIRVSNIKDSLIMIKDSFVYFLSSVATTAFAALNTVLIGIFIEDLTQIAYWSLCLSITSAIQGLYSPITNSVYPYMIKERSLSFIHKILLIFMPIVTAGCIICFVFADFAMLVVGGEKYLEAAELFRYFVPILFFSFPAQIYGWPTLGAIGQVKETTISTIIAALLQVVGIVFLVLINQFTLVHLAVLRLITEASLMGVRMLITYRNKNAFYIKTSNI